MTATIPNFACLPLAVPPLSRANRTARITFFGWVPQITRRMKIDMIFTLSTGKSLFLLVDSGKRYEEFEFLP